VGSGRLNGEDDLLQKDMFGWHFLFLEREECFTCSVYGKGLCLLRVSMRFPRWYGDALCGLVCWIRLIGCCSWTMQLSVYLLST
jgi:hypothetical protein